MSRDLNPDKALIFRIIHRDNLTWILDHGLHCKNVTIADPNFINIGNIDLIVRRNSRRVPCYPGGTLSDYVPFYFTPWSPMMYNIKTGWGGIRQRSNDEIIILVSSLPNLEKMRIPFVFTDRHAYLQAARFSSSVSDLHWIVWDSLQARDFKRDNDDPEKFEKYQAEALVYREMPTSALLGLACYDEKRAGAVRKLLSPRALSLQVIAQPKWYF